MEQFAKLPNEVPARYTIKQHEFPQPLRPSTSNTKLPYRILHSHFQLSHVKEMITTAQRHAYFFRTTCSTQPSCFPPTWSAALLWIPTDVFNNSVETDVFNSAELLLSKKHCRDFVALVIEFSTEPSSFCCLFQFTTTPTPNTGGRRVH